MKYTNKWLLALLPAALLSSCAEDVFEPYQVDKPASLKEAEYLTGYNTLQSYTQLKLSADADFKAYNNRGALYNIVASNFKEVSAAATATHAALVDEKTGIVNSSAIYDVVTGAKNAEQSVFGTAIFGNTNVSGKYLQSLVADRIDPNATAAPKIQYDSLLVFNADCEGEDMQSFSANGNCSVKLDNKGKGGGNCVVFTNNGTGSETWSSQFFVTLSAPVPAGTEIELSVDIKADVDISDGLATQAHKKVAPGENGYIAYGTFGAPKFTTDWATYSFKAASPSDECQRIAFDLGKAPATNLYFDNIKVHAVLEIDAPAEYWVDIVDNGDCEGESVASFFQLTGGETNPTESAVLVPGAGKDGSQGIVVNATAKLKVTWDNQFFIRFTEPIPENSDFKFSMDIKAETATGKGIGTQSHAEPRTYINHGTFGFPEFKDDWSHYEFTGTMTGGNCQTIAINLSEFDNANKYYFDNIVFQIKKENKATIPLTPEEKQANLNVALDKWITGIFEGADGYITDWVLFEGIFDKDGNLKAKEVKADNEFVWQSYYDDPDAYLHDVAKKARELGAKKLFISETDLANSGKLAKLVDWVKGFETDETSTIDGIDAQLGKIEFADDMSAWKQSYDEMLAGLAASGKLIRISGITIDDSKAKETEQQKAIGEFYAYIISKYLEVIPASQQYGVSLPTSLWSDNNRTHQYGSLADGLK